MSGARGARLMQSAAAPTAPQMTTVCSACGARPGRACTSLAPGGETDPNLALKPSHYARRYAYEMARSQPAPDAMQERPDLAPDFEVEPDAG